MTRTPATGSPLAVAELDALDRRLLDEFQRDFPLDERPYLTLARRLGCSEETVLGRLADLSANGMIARIGAVFRPHRVGASTLAALAAPSAELDAVAALVNGYDEVSHNYVRDHAFNLWFVVTGNSRERVRTVLAEIEAATGFEVLDLPMVRGYWVDMGFPLWN